MLNLELLIQSLEKQIIEENTEEEKALFNLFLRLYEKIGYNSIILARKLSLSLSLIEGLISKCNDIETEDRVFEPFDIDYTLPIGSLHWFLEFSYLPVKTLNRSLKKCI